MYEYLQVKFIECDMFSWTVSVVPAPPGIYRMGSGRTIPVLPNKKAALQLLFNLYSLSAYKSRLPISIVQVGD
jgi:hypothetical protein